jgi:hypothetical protein
MMVVDMCMVSFNGVDHDEWMDAKLVKMLYTQSANPILLTQ